MEIIKWINLGDELIKRENMVSSMLFTLSYSVNYLRERIQEREVWQNEEENHYFEFGVWQLGEYIYSTAVKSQEGEQR